MNMMGAMLGLESFSPSVEIQKAENGFVVKTMAIEEVDDPGHVQHGDPMLPPKKVKEPRQKTHVFSNIEQTLKFVKDYLEKE